MKTAQTSLVDFVTKTMPEFSEAFGKGSLRKGRMSVLAANKLFTLWSKQSHNGKTIIRPTELTTDEIKLMEQEGLIRESSEGLEITVKGGNILKTMILGDDSSSFDKTANFDYEKAVDTTMMRAKKAKVASTQPILKCSCELSWYGRLKNDSPD